MLDAGNAIWDDGEWVSWDEINQQVQYHEWRAKYPNADRSLIPVFEQLLNTAEEYFNATGKHLNVYGDIGELYAAITYGIKLHRNHAEGSDGRMGNDFVEVKTITPLSSCDAVLVKRSGHFSKLMIVKINEDFEVAHRMIDRKSLRKGDGKFFRVKWQNLSTQQA